MEFKFKEVAKNGEAGKRRLSFKSMLLIYKDRQMNNLFSLDFAGIYDLSV